tara:strand:- start:140 stop:1240 length:1101 start_codon:yes stop_codon:yes gene_type:complete
MGYLQVLNLMIKAYKAARGVMPKGLDLLKLQQKARQKVIDSKKVIQFPKDRITDPFKPRPTKPEGTIPVTVKGKTSKMSPEGIMNMLTKQGKDVKLGQAPKTTKVKPSVDPKLVQQESTRELYKRLTRQNREAIRNFNKRNKDDPTKKAKGGIMGYAVGGMTQNLIGTYQANPTLQDQYTQQEYLDLFGTGTAQPQTVNSVLQNMVQPTRVAAAPVVPPVIKPIIIPGQEGDGGSGITTIQPRAPKEPLTFRESMAQLNLQRGVIEEAEEEKGILQTLLAMSPTAQTFKFLKDKGVAAKNRFDDFMKDQRNKRIQEEKDAAQREFDRLNALRQIRDAESMSGGPGETTQGTFGSSVNNPSTFSDYS